ncbi:MAG: ribonuclease R, partial [Bacteroidota bacterium]
MTRKKSKTKGQKLNVRDLKTQITKLFKRDHRKRLTAKQVIKKLKIANSKDSVQHALEKLTNKGILFTPDQVKFKLDKFSNVNQQNGGGSVARQTYEGYVDMTRTGAAYIMVDNLEDDIYVAAKALNTALHGDKVEVRVRHQRGRRKPDGEIVKVLERAREFFIGTLRLSRKYGIVIPDRLNMPVDIYVDLDNLNEARDGEKVIVKIIKWPGNANKSPIGRVTTVLGKVGSHDIEMQAILINN